MTVINSASNEKFKSWNQLGSAKGIKKNNEFILMGEKLIHEFLKNPSLPIKAEILREGHTALTKERNRIFQLSMELFKELDVLGTHFNLLVLELPEPQIFKTLLPEKSLQLIAPLGDPSNLGSLIRSAVGFGIHSVVLTKESAHPFHPKAVKASAGSLLKCQLMYSELSLAELVQGLDGTAALDLKGTSLRSFQPATSVRLIVGEEGPGIGTLKVQHKIKIETKNIESLNATVAASIAMWELSQKMR